VTEYLQNRFVANGRGCERIVTKKGRLRMDLPVSLFQPTFSAFCTAAESFAIALSDPLDRKFAYRYLTYLQEVANGTEEVKPSTVGGRPTCRLICNELERIFRAHFFQPETAAAAARSEAA